jgi:hypothetical protein
VPNDDKLVRTVVWRSLWFHGTEFCRLWQTRDGWRFSGTAIGTMNDRPMRAGYDIHCDAQWRTHRLELVRELGAESKKVSLAVEGRGGWRSGSGELPALAACVDVDLGVTPATNTLPIRRLELKVGESKKIIAAWVKFPGLEIQPLAQTYTRLSENRYRYESPGFSAELHVDELGLVITYKNGWERLATG